MSSSIRTTLHYIYDPMCSWCWGFRRTWDEIQQQLPHNIIVHHVLGGLAPDSSEPMSDEMQTVIKGHWRRIQDHIPGVEFNYDFWRLCQPRRSTYPACRAIIAATLQGELFELKMIDAIQRAYYLEAQNPSDDETLLTLAAMLGMDYRQFALDFFAKATQDRLDEHIKYYHYLSGHSGVSGFPSLVLDVESRYLAVPLDYVNPETSLDFIRQHMAR